MTYFLHGTVDWFNHCLYIPDMRFLFGLLISSLLTTVAHADEVPCSERDAGTVDPECPTPVVPVQRSSVDFKNPVRYGEQVAIVDLITGGIAIGLFAADTEAKWVGAGAFVLGAPLVHAVHGQLPQTFAGMGIRVMTPGLGCVSGAITGLIVAPGSEREGNMLEGLEVGCKVGAIGGMVLASVLDAAFLAREYKVQRPTGGVQWQPQIAIDPKRDSAHVGLSGTF